MKIKLSTLRSIIREVITVNEDETAKKKKKVARVRYDQMGVYIDRVNVHDVMYERDPERTEAEFEEGTQVFQTEVMADMLRQGGYTHVVDRESDVIEPMPVEEYIAFREETAEDDHSLAGMIDPDDLADIQGALRDAEQGRDQADGINMKPKRGPAN